MLKPYLRNVSGKPIKSDITMFTGGLNTCYDKAMIRDNQMPYMWNMTLNNSMSMTTRSNRESLAWFLEDTTNWGTGEIQKMFATSDKTLLTIEKVGNNTEVYELKKESNYLTKDYIGQVENSSFYSIAECRDSSTKYFMISTLHKLYKVSKDAFTETLEDVTDENNPICGVLAGHKNRLFVANGIDLFISKLRQYDDFTIVDGQEESGHQIRITNANGDIKALVPYDNKLIILCERSMHVLYGSSPLSEVDQFTIVDFNNGIGCISDETWTICNKMLYWLDTDMSVYRYNGSGIVKISEEYGSDNYASYGGINGITYNPIRLKQFVMSSYGDLVYICITQSRLSNAVNDTLLVYNTKNRVWWAEDGEFSHMCKWETDTQTPFYYATDYLIGSMYNNDVVIMNALQKIDTDHLFNMETRHFDDIDIDYAFETKTWTLGTIKKEKTLTNIWFQANAEGRVAVCDYWNEHNVWDGAVTKLDDNYLILGNLKKVGVRHNVQNPTATLHQGTERQRFIIPRMYMQKINAFSIRVEGTGYSEFYMMEKEWRIK